MICHGHAHCSGVVGNDKAVDEAKAEIYREIYGDLPCASPRLKPLAPEQLLSQAAATTGEKDEPPP